MPICPKARVRYSPQGTDPEIGIIASIASADGMRNLAARHFRSENRPRHLPPCPAVLLGVIDKLALIGQHTRANHSGVMGMLRMRQSGKREVNGRFLSLQRGLQLQRRTRRNHCERFATAYREGCEGFLATPSFAPMIIQE